MNWRGAWDTLRRWLGPRRALPEFSCGDCDYHDRCGLPPSDDCIEKIAQIERGGAWRHRYPAYAERPGRILF